MHPTQPDLSHRATRLSLARNAVSRAFSRAGAWVERHSGLSLTLLLLVYALAELGYSLAAPLWHDELFTFYIAQAPSTSAMLQWIRHVDLNPPVSYLLTRASFKLFGVGTLQCRLPEIAGFACALVAIFAFVRRRAGAAFGLLAAALLFGSRAGELVVQARPYGLMLGAGTCALAFWQAASEPRSRPSWAANLGLFAALTVLLLTHVFGLFFWAALAAGEAAQTILRRRFAFGRAAALVLPLLATLSHAPLVRNHAQSAFPSAFQPTGSDIFIFYMGHIDRELVCLWLSAFVIVLVAGRSWLRGSDRFALTSPEWIAVSGFIAAPLALIAHLMLAHGAFFDRYGVIACVGVAVLFSVFFHWWTARRPGAAVVAAVLALLITGRLPDAVAAAAHGQVFRHTEPTIVPLDTHLLRNPTLPVVIASGLTFLEMQRREPEALLSRTVYLTSEDAALQYAHATIFEGMAEEVRLFGLRRHVEPYREFVSTHQTFYVLGTYDYPEDWVLRKLQADGARLEVLGRATGSYKDHELYEASFPGPPLNP